MIEVPTTGPRLVAKGNISWVCASPKPYTFMTLTRKPFCLRYPKSPCALERRAILTAAPSREMLFPPPGGAFLLRQSRVRRHLPTHINFLFCEKHLIFFFCLCIISRQYFAGVMELADVTDSKSVGGNTVRVRPPPPAPVKRKACEAGLSFYSYS